MTANLGDRSTYLGASDAPRIFGLGFRPETDAIDLWYSKVYGTDPGADRGSEAIDVGDALEPDLIAYAARKLSPSSVERDHRVEHPNGFMVAHLDSVFHMPDARRLNVEAKSSSLMELHPDHGQWGEAWTDEVPPRVVVQTIAQDGITEAAGEPIDEIVVPAVLVISGRLRLRIYHIPKIEGASETVVAKMSDWWNTHVAPAKEARASGATPDQLLAFAPPSGEPPSMEVLRKIRRVPQSTATIPPELAEAYASTLALKSQAEKDHEASKRSLLAAIGDAEAGDWGDDRDVFAYLPQGRRSCDYDMLKALYPAAYALTVRENVSRTLRRQKRRF